MTTKPRMIACPHREHLTAEWSLCRIAEAETAKGFGKVHETLCAACEKAGSQTLEAPNRYLASAIIGGAIDAFKAGVVSKKKVDSIAERFVPFTVVEGQGSTDNGVNRPKPCFHLGRQVGAIPGCNCPRRFPHECKNFVDAKGVRLIVIQEGQCETCPAYEEE